MAGIPNDPLQRFRNVGANEQVSLEEGVNDLTHQEKTGKLGKRFARWFSGTNDAENNRATKAFFDSLKEVYGKRVTDWAIDGYENRLTDGKPLSGYRIQRILERAESAKTQDAEALPQLLKEGTPLLLNDALKRAGLQIPKGVANEWRNMLAEEIRKDISKDAKFTAPRKLQSSSFGQEFGGIADAIVNKYRDAIPQIGKFEERRQQMLDNPKALGDWGMVRPEDLDKVVFPPGHRQNFLDRFGNGDGKISDFDSYWNEEIVEPGERAFEKTNGSKTNFHEYEQLFSQDKKHDGVYKEFGVGNGFAEFGRLDTGKTRPGLGLNVRDEKFHISVQPKDISQAYGVLAPILLSKDCPISYWKVSDVATFQNEAEQAQQKLQDFKDGKDIQYDSTATYNKNKLKDSDQQIVHDELAKKERNLRRVFESCQFTLYPMKGEDSSKFIDMLDEIEQALRGAGLAPPQTPDTDEGVTGFVSFRIGAKEVDGKPVRIDPFDKDYPEFKKTFSSNPFYLGQGFNLVSTEINRMLDRVSRGDKVANAEIDVLQEKINSMRLSDEHRGKLNQRLDGLRQAL